MPYNKLYENSKLLSVRFTFKRDFYAWSYGSYKSSLICQDALDMYDMGCEL
jgi:hypothetical protein